MATVTESPAEATTSDTPSRSAPSPRSRLIVVARIGLIVLVLVLWQLISGRLIPAYAISRPTDVATSLVQVLTSSSGWQDILTTTIEVAAGFALGVVSGTVLGLVLGTFPVAGRVLEPLIAAINGIPKIALAPLFLLFFGIGVSSKIAIAAIGVSFVVFYNLYLGLRQRDRQLVEIVELMGGRVHHTLMYVTVPTLASPFFAALKAGGPLAILGVIGAEFIASTQGVGHQLFNAAMALDAPGEFAGLIVLVVMTLVLNGLLTQLDKYALKRLGLAPRKPRSRS